MISNLADTRTEFQRTVAAEMGTSQMTAMLSREREFPSELAAAIAGIAMSERGRRRVDRRAERLFGQPWVLDDRVLPEVVVGSGPHALIYAAVRSAKGVPVTLIERNVRAGGSFACSQGPSFWLNSRNRPGPLGLPGEGRGLNVLPGCLMQPSMVGGGEYQTNYDLAWTVRVNLLLDPNITVHTGVTVDEVQLTEDQKFRIYLEGNVASNGDERPSVFANRVVFATGIGDSNPFTPSGDQEDVPARQLSFEQFMGRMDQTFPLRGMRRVAVIGGNDSGRTAIEALTGQGPTSGMSVAALDFPEVIDWYGPAYTNQRDWCANVRGRYARIGKLLGTRVNPLGNSNYYPTPGFEGVSIGPKQYDMVINCTGYQPSPIINQFRGWVSYSLNDRVVGRVSEGREVYRIGPAAGIPVDGSDRDLVPILSSIPENSTSLFRYAPLTAALADALPVLQQKPQQGDIAVFEGPGIRFGPNLATANLSFSDDF